MYICVPIAIWRRLLISFVAFARCEIVVYTGYVNDIMIAITPRTTIISIRVNAHLLGGGELLLMDGEVTAHHIAHKRRAKAKRTAKARLLDKGFCIRCM